MMSQIVESMHVNSSKLACEQLMQGNIEPTLKVLKSAYCNDKQLDITDDMLPHESYVVTEVQQGEKLNNISRIQGAHQHNSYRPALVLYSGVRFINYYNNMLSNFAAMDTIELCLLQHRLNSAVFSLPEAATNKLVEVMVVLLNTNPNYSGKLNLVYGPDFMEKLETNALENMVTFYTENLRILVQESETRRRTNRHVVSHLPDYDTPQTVYSVYQQTLMYIERTIYSFMRLHGVSSLNGMEECIDNLWMSCEKLQQIIQKLLDISQHECRLWGIKLRDINRYKRERSKIKMTNSDLSAFDTLYTRMKERAKYDKTSYPYPPCLGGDIVVFNHVVDNMRTRLCRQLLLTPLEQLCDDSELAMEAIFRTNKVMSLKIAVACAMDVNMTHIHGNFIGLLYNNGLAHKLHNVALNKSTATVRLQLNLLQIELENRQYRERYPKNEDYRKLFKSELYYLRNRYYNVLYLFLSTNEYKGFITLVKPIMRLHEQVNNLHSKLQSELHKMRGRMKLLSCSLDQMPE